MSRLGGLHHGHRRAAGRGRGQAALFALIAGTHTPVQGLYFRGVARWGVLGLMWLVAATGITSFSVFHDSLPRGLGTTACLVMGWIAGVAGIVVLRRQGTSRVWLLILGGVVHSVGAVFLGLEWPTIWPGTLGAHELWHVAVLAAMGLHWGFAFENARQPMDEEDEPARRSERGPQSPRA